MAIEVIKVNDGTQTPVAFDQVGTVYEQVIKLDVSADGAANADLFDGKIRGGTINVGTIAISTNGTIDSGSISVVAGTVNAGTIDLLKAGTITRLEQGSVNVTAGTITAGTITNLVSGTINSATAVINSATISVLPNVTLAGGTVQNLNAGTITSVTEVANLAKGTVTSLEGGTLGLITRVGNIGTLEVGTVTIGAVNSIGTLGTLQLGTITGNIGTLSMLSAGTLTTIPNIPGGTLNVLAAGTINSATVVVNSATISVLPNLPQGSINVTAGTMIMTVGTIGGKAASGAAAVANPVLMAGTDSGGTVYAPLVDTSGRLHTVMEVGTVNVGTVTTAVQVGTLNVGTINTGTINSGTVDLLKAGTITKVEGGSMAVTAGTVFGAAASGAAASGNPVPMAGTDAGGTVYTFLTDTAGHMKNDIVTGTVTSVTEVANLAKGTITRLEGGTLGMLSAGTISMINAGTLTSSGTTTGVGVVSNLTNGSVRITVGTITVLPNLPGGSIAVTAGTVIMTNGTVGAGTVVVSAATVAAGTISARNTENVLTYGTQFAATAAAYATLVGSASVGVGTSCYVQNFNIINPAGTVLSLLGFGTVLNGTSVLFRGVVGTQTVGGIQKSWDKPVNAGMTNQDLVLYLGAAGTVDVNVSYFIKV